MIPTDLSLRVYYDFGIPRVLGSARNNRRLNVLIAKTSLTSAESIKLVQLQLAKWYCAELDDVQLDIALHIPENAETTRDVFDRLGVEYAPVPSLDESSPESVISIAQAISCDMVLCNDAPAVRKILSDDYAQVTTEIEHVLHAVEIHLKGFDVPWSFEFPTKSQPWTNFYVMCERSVFASLIQEWMNSAKAGPQVQEIMRSLVADSLQSMCFSRDRVEFYRQQDRWAKRSGIERQDFRLEYIAYLNHFYLSLYAAVDQVAALVVRFYGMDIPEQEVGAQYAAFRKARKAVPAINKLFSGKTFWRMYKVPRLIRHHAAHRGPVTPQTVYFGDDNFTTDQLDAAAHQHGYYDDLIFIEKHQALQPDFKKWLIDMARFKAKLKLLGAPMRNAVFLQDGKKGLFYYPDPANDFRKLIDFIRSVLEVMKPWEGSHDSAGSFASVDSGSTTSEKASASAET